jgi:hypothetical protein
LKAHVLLSTTVFFPSAAITWRIIGTIFQLFADYVICRHSSLCRLYFGPLLRTKKPLLSCRYCDSCWKWHKNSKNSKTQVNFVLFAQRVFQISRLWKKMSVERNKTKIFLWLTATVLATKNSACETYLLVKIIHVRLNLIIAKLSQTSDNEIWR